MKLVALCLVVVAAVNAQSTDPAVMDRMAAIKATLTSKNSWSPEWEETPEEGNGMGTGQKDNMLGGKDHVRNVDGGTLDAKDMYNYKRSLHGGTFDPKDEDINMTPYVIQTKDERWEAGVPNYEAPEEGYLIQTFDVEGDARDWVKDKVAADNSINYPLSPDIDPEDNPANPNNPEDKNPNVMQDDAPTHPPQKQLGHMEPAYVGEYDHEELFGPDHADNGSVEGIAHGKDHGDLQKAIYLEESSFSSLRDRRQRAFTRGTRN